MPSVMAPVVRPGTIATAGQPTLVVDQHLVLRPFAQRDRGILIEEFGDDAIQHWHGSRFDSEAEASEWIERWNDHWRQETGARWAVVDGRADRVVGQVGLRLIDLPAGWAELSCWVARTGRSCGVGRAAMVRLTEWALDDLGLHRLQGEHSIDNHHACRLMESAGYAAEGVRREAVLHRDGWHDMHLHARLSKRATFSAPSPVAESV